MSKVNDFVDSYHNGAVERCYNINGCTLKHTSCAAGIDDCEICDPVCERADDCTCGYERDTFACRVRHIYLNSGAAKAAND